MKSPLSSGAPFSITAQGEKTHWRGNRCLHIYETQILYFVSEETKSGEAVRLTLSLMLSLGIKCFYCALLPAGPTISNQWTDKSIDPSTSIFHRHQLHTPVLVTNIRFVLLFDISDSAQTSGNIFVLFVAESKNGKNQNQRQRMSFSQSQNAPRISEARALGRKGCRTVFFFLPCTEKALSAVLTHIRLTMVSDSKSL